MTTSPPKNISASVHQRLLNLAKAHEKRFNDIAQHYALERWLYRLSRSPYVDRFVLKGGTDADGLADLGKSTDEGH